MLWAVWIALAVGLAAFAFGVYRLVRQVLGFFRALRRLRGEVLSSAETLARSAERLGEHGDAVAKLEPALARLGRSQARLSVLLAAVDEVRGSVGRVTAVYPHK